MVGEDSLPPPHGSEQGGPGPGVCMGQGPVCMELVCMGPRLVCIGPVCMGQGLVDTGQVGRCHTYQMGIVVGCMLQLGQVGMIVGCMVHSHHSYMAAAGL